MRVDLNKSFFIVRYDGQTKHLDKSSETFKVTALKKAAQDLKLTFAASDLIPTLNALTEQAILGRMKICANENSLTFTYKTEVANYMIAIPTSNLKGKRNTDAFSAYGESNGN